MFSCDRWFDGQEKRVHMQFFSELSSRNLFFFFFWYTQTPLNFLNGCFLFLYYLFIFLEMLDNVVETVGEKKVVQEITNNASNYKTSGEMLIEKRKMLFQIPCTTHCPDLIRENFEKRLKTHQETVANTSHFPLFSSTFSCLWHSITIHDTAHMHYSRIVG